MDSISAPLLNLDDLADDLSANVAPETIAQMFVGSLWGLLPPPDLFDVIG